MTEDELENLADLIVDKIIKRQAEYDAEFMQQLKESSEENDFEFNLKDGDQHKIDEEIKRLEKLLQKALNSENYEYAAKLVEQINNIKNR
jgi:excinuclease UvrABC helicase subunit UvrB